MQPPLISANPPFVASPLATGARGAILVSMSRDIDARPIDAADFSPQLYARIGGVLYLLIIAAGQWRNKVLCRETTFS